MTDLAESMEKLAAAERTLHDAQAQLTRKPNPNPTETAAESVAVGEHNAEGFRGSDHTGSITVTLDEDLKLVDVHILDRWDGQLEPAGMGTALMEAYRPCVSAALLSRPARSVRDEQTATAAVDQATPPPSVPPTLDELIAECRASRHRNENEWFRRKQELDMAGAPEPHDVQGDFGYVRLRIQGGAVTSATPNVGALEHASTDYLKRDLESAFSNAGLLSPHAVVELGGAGDEDSQAHGSDDDEELWQGLEWE